MSSKISRSCGSVIYKVSEDNQINYLLVKGLNSEWGFAKGNSENGETSQEAAKREIKEEVGIDVGFTDGFKEVYTYNLKLRKLFFFEKVIQKEVIIFLSEVSGDPDIKTQRSEILDYGWFDFNQAYEKINFKERKRILKKAHEFIQNKNK